MGGDQKPSAPINIDRDFFSGLPTRVFGASSAAEIDLHAALSAVPLSLSPRPMGGFQQETAQSLSQEKLSQRTAQVEPAQTRKERAQPRLVKEAVKTISATVQADPHQLPVEGDADSSPKASSAPSDASAPSVPSGPPTPYTNPLMRRIASARRWQDLASLVEQQPQRLDAVAVAMALSRLSELVPPGGPSRLKKIDGATGLLEDTPASVGVAELATELMSLLQLQLPRLPASSLAAALGAAGKLEARPPRAAWLGSALGAVLFRLTRCEKS